MKYWLLSIIFVVAIISLGPSVNMNESITPVILTDDLDAYLAVQENQIEGIRPETEKTIIWQDPNLRTPTPISIIYIHGLSASRQEVAPLCDRIAKTLKANLFYTRLSGHGRSGQAMKNATINAMLNDTHEAMQIGMALGEKVIVIASSTGATLATINMMNSPRTFQNSIAALIFLSPNFGLKRIESELLLLPWAKTIVALIEGHTYQFQAQNELQEKYWTTEYPSKVLIEMMGLVELSRNRNLQQLQTPVLMLYSPRDSVVSVVDIKNTFSRFGSQTKQLLPVLHSNDRQRHILAGKALSPDTTTDVYNKIITFIKILDTAK